MIAYIYNMPHNRDIALFISTHNLFIFNRFFIYIILLLFCIILDIYISTSVLNLRRWFYLHSQQWSLPHHTVNIPEKGGGLLLKN